MKRMILRAGLLGPLAAVALLGPVHAAGLDGLASLFDDGDSRLNSWIANPAEKARFGDWDYVALQAREEGAEPSSHPVQLSAEALAPALAGIRVASGKDIVPLFEPEEVSRLSRAIAGGLAKASAAQDFVFVSTARHQVLGAFGQKLTSSGRVFYRAGELNLILGVQLSDALLGLRPGTRPTRAILPGERARAADRVAIVEAGSGGRLLRRDWLAIPLQAGVARPSQALAPAAEAAPATALDPSVQKHFDEQQTRLLLLKRLRDQGVISDAEYEAKRAETLRQL